jgi:hypothetical protein
MRPIEQRKIILDNFINGFIEIKAQIEHASAFVKFMQFYLNSIQIKGLINQLPDDWSISTIENLLLSSVSGHLRMKTETLEKYNLNKKLHLLVIQNSW